MNGVLFLIVDQKRRMWEVSKIQNQKQNHRKRSGGGSTIAPDLGPKLKRQSVAEDAADFLIEASKELLVIQQNQVVEVPPWDLRFLQFWQQQPNHMDSQFKGSQILSLNWVNYTHIFSFMDKCSWQNPLAKIVHLKPHRKWGY